MKTFLLKIVILSIVVFNTMMMVGCGSLNRDINLHGLTPSDIAYAKTIEGGTPTLSIDTPAQTFVTQDTSNDFFVAPPVFFHWDSLGVDGNKYGYIHTLNVLLLYTEFDAALYNSTGKATGNIDSIFFSPFYGYINYVDDQDGTMFGFDILPLPIVGVTLYGQVVAKDGKEVTASRYFFLNLPIIGPCFATRKGPKTGTSRFLWIPYDGFGE